eukprot:TRINITY_DN13118_c0_g1_i1.p1 TRINITY_DN13118_c0_g1~~TRINITY_DN13118_c0_g1_i1.p1  ORF type:complete len:284 (-),score=17.97 TRINITY_DN13118_c0_g1_i1:51-878(-)
MAAGRLEGESMANAPSSHDNYSHSNWRTNSWQQYDAGAQTQTHRFSSRTRGRNSQHHQKHDTTGWKHSGSWRTNETVRGRGRRGATRGRGRYEYCGQGQHHNTAAQPQVAWSGVVWCDLDGVLSDFVGRSDEIWNGKGMYQVGLDPYWKKLETWTHPKTGEGFYASLDWMADGQQLWEAIQHLQPTVLTGLPEGQWAAPQKHTWCQRNLGPEVAVVCCMARDKHTFCKPGDLLIDDNWKAAEPWLKAGGIFVHHKNTQNTFRQLQSMGILPTEFG